jgi:hypothetical protein
MADGFGVERAVAEDLAGSLASIRTAMNGLGQELATGVTGSSKVEAALARFYRESSENREMLDKLLERGAAMMRGLAEGTRAVDQGLSDALTTTTGSSPATTPATAGSPVSTGPSGLR